MQENNLELEKERNRRIKKEINRINKLFKNVSKDKKELIKELIKRASFLLIISEDIEKQLKVLTKFTEKTINASQEFVKPNPLYKEYRDTIKSYQSLMKQLTDLSKEFGEEKLPEQDPLEEFNNELY